MKPTFDQIIAADCRKEKQLMYLMKYVSEIKWIKKNKIALNLNNLQSLYFKLRKKYPFTIGHIMPASEQSWSAMLKTTDTHQWINTICFQSFLEMYLKVIIIADAYFNGGNLQHDEKGRPDEEV